MNVQQEYQDSSMWALVKCVDDTDPNWDQVITVIDTLSGLRTKFDMAHSIRNGAKLLSPSELRKHLARGVEQEIGYQKQNKY